MCVPFLSTAAVHCLLLLFAPVSFFRPPPPPTSTLFPYTTLFRSGRAHPRSAGRLRTGPGAPRGRWRRAGGAPGPVRSRRSEEHTSELQSRENLVCRLLLEKKKKQNRRLSDHDRRVRNTSP